MNDAINTSTKLQLGTTVMTRSVRDAAEADPTFALLCMVSLVRHEHSDWGDIDEFDRQMNDAAVAAGDLRVLSSYRLPADMSVGDTKIWIITEADRSSTTILFPSEY